MKYRLKFKLPLLVVAFLISSNCFASFATVREKAVLEITYIANEGLMISSGQSSLLIDSLYREGVEGYETIPPAQLEKLETARSPFDRVSLILVSHPHRDHFDATSVARHLENNRKAVLVSSPQVTDALKQYGNYEKIKQRVQTVLPEGTEKIQKSFGDIKVTFLRLRHGYARNYGVHNLGHIIEIGGKRLLHIGDAEALRENFSKLELEKENIAIALLPFWFLTGDERAIVDEHIKPKQVVALHIPPKGAESYLQQVKAAYPEALLCTKPMESRRYF